jgi:hypothetical protein
MGLDTKTYWLTDRQSQCDFDFDFDFDFDPGSCWQFLSECSYVQVRRKLKERIETRSMEEYKWSVCEDVKCDWKISCVIL